MRVIDIHVNGVDLVIVIFRSAFAHNTQTLPQASWNEEAICYNSLSHLVFLQGEVNSARYIAQVVNPVNCHFFDVISCAFQHYNAHPHTAAATQRIFRGVQLPWTARSPDLSPIEYVRDVNEAGPYSFSRAYHKPIKMAELRQRAQDTLDNLSQDDIRHLYDRLHVRIHACVAARGSYTVY